MKKLVIYPGRFQPFHKGHAQVYQWLKNKFGDAIIATSDKVEAPKSPFNFQEKKRMMGFAGVPAAKIKQVLNPYLAREILKDFDPKTTVLIFAVSQKDMEEDPRFNFAATKSGKPGYLQPYAGNEKNLKPFEDVQKMKGYVIVTPTFTFDVLGKPATSASELRKQFMTLDNKKQKEFIKDLFGKYDADIHKLMKTKIGAMQKTIKQLREEVTRKELAPMLDSFVSFASDKLGLKSMPKVRYKTDGDKYNSFAAYNPLSNELSVHTMNRHPMDIFRSVAHELVHHKQNEDGRLGKDIEKEGATGSDIENEANSEAGKIMRWFAKANPNMFGQSYVIEEIANSSSGVGIRGLGNVTGNPSMDDSEVSNYISQNIEDTESIAARLQRLIGKNTTDTLYSHEYEEPWMDKKDKEEYHAKTIKGFKAMRAQLNEVTMSSPASQDLAKSLEAKRQGKESFQRFIRPGASFNSTPKMPNVDPKIRSNTPVISKRADPNRYVGSKTDTIKMKMNGKEKEIKALNINPNIGQRLEEGINDPGKLKAIFLAGGPGSGKDFVMNSVLQGEGLKEVNSDVAFEYLMRKNGLDLEMPDEEKVERDIVRGRAKNITKEKERLALAGRLGLIINGTADDLEKIKTVKQKLENDGYETMMVFVNTSNEVSRQRNVERGKMGNRKVPDGTDKQGVPDGSEDIRQEKWDLAQKNIGELQKIFGNKSFAVIDNTADIRKVSPEEKQSIQTTFDRVRRMAQQFVRAENQNPAAKKWIEGEAQKRGIIQYQEPKRYKTLTQTQQSIPQVVHKPDNELMAQARRLGLSYYGFGRFGRRVGNQNKVLFHSKGGKLVKVQEMNEKFEKYMKDPANREVGTKALADNYKKMTPGQEVAEDNVIPRGKFGMPQSGGLGPEYGIQVSPALVTGFANIGNSVYEASPSIQKWANDKKTQEKFTRKYGKLAEQKLIEAALALEEAGCGCDHSKPKSVKKIKETVGYPSAKDPQDEMGIVPVQVKEDQLNERGADSKGYYRSTESGAGLTRKGAKHFGIKTAVTTPPSKLDPKGEAAKRRRRFCARMGGMPGPMKDEKGRPTRKAMSLRRWNCEE